MGQGEEGPDMGRNLEVTFWVVCIQVTLSTRVELTIDASDWHPKSKPRPVQLAITSFIKGLEHLKLGDREGSEGDSAMGESSQLFTSCCVDL